MPLVNVDIGSIASGLGTLAKDLREAITGKTVIDGEKAAELALKATEAENALILAQAEITKTEAGSARFWVAGARPFIIWTGGAVIAYVYIISPILKSFGVNSPEMNLNELWPIITSVLGLGAYRTYEKVKGATK